MQDSFSNMDDMRFNEQLNYLAELTNDYYSNIISVGYEKTDDRALGELSSNNMI